MSKEIAFWAGMVGRGRVLTYRVWHTRSLDAFVWHCSKLKEGKKACSLRSVHGCGIVDQSWRHLVSSVCVCFGIVPNTRSFEKSARPPCAMLWLAYVAGWEPTDVKAVQCFYNIFNIINLCTSTKQSNKWLNSMITFGLFFSFFFWSFPLCSNRFDDYKNRI